MDMVSLLTLMEMSIKGIGWMVRRMGKELSIIVKRVVIRIMTRKMIQFLRLNLRGILIIISLGEKG